MIIAINQWVYFNVESGLTIRFAPEANRGLRATVHCPSGHVMVFIGTPDNTDASQLREALEVMANDGEDVRYVPEALEVMANDGEDVRYVPAPQQGQ